MSNEIFVKRMEPMLDEFHAIIDGTLRDDEAMHRWRATDVSYDVGASTIRPQLRGVPTGQGVHPVDRIFWMPDRPLLVELASRTIEHRSRRFDGERVQPVAADWKRQLRRRWSGMFDCQIKVGPGWADLILAYVEQRTDAGDRFKFVRIEEKYGCLRFYVVGGDTPLEWIADHLSTSICEVCGAPGKWRDQGWIKTLCNEHVKEWS